MYIVIVILVCSTLFVSLASANSDWTRPPSIKSEEIITTVQNETYWNRSGSDVILHNTDDNVGIGTLSPSERLDVNGNIKGILFCDGTDCYNLTSINYTVSNVLNIIDSIGNWSNVFSDYYNKTEIVSINTTMKEYVDSKVGTGNSTMDFADTFANRTDISNMVGNWSQASEFYYNSTEHNANVTRVLNIIDSLGNWSNVMEDYYNKSEIVDINTTMKNYVDNAIIPDTNETTRFNYLVTDNCTGTDKVIGINENGTIWCSADQTGAGTDTRWALNDTNYLINSSDGILFNESQLNETIRRHNLNDTNTYNDTGDFIKILTSTVNSTFQSTYNETYEGQIGSLGNFSDAMDEYVNISQLDNISIIRADNTTNWDKDTTDDITYDTFTAAFNISLANSTADFADDFAPIGVGDWATASEFYYNKTEIVSINSTIIDYVNVNVSTILNIIDSLGNWSNAMGDYVNTSQLDNVSIIRAGNNVSWITDNQYQNETVRFSNLTSFNCSGTDKMIGVNENGSIWCASDETGAGGGWALTAAVNSSLANSTADMFGIFDTAFNDTFRNLSIDYFGLFNALFNISLSNSTEDYADDFAPLSNFTNLTTGECSDGNYTYGFYPNGTVKCRDDQNTGTDSEQLVLEQYDGSDADGNDGEFNRSISVANGVSIVSVDGVTLINLTDYEYLGGSIKFLNKLWDEQYITIWN